MRDPYSARLRRREHSEGTYERLFVTPTRYRRRPRRVRGWADAILVRLAWRSAGLDRRTV
jgi:hypothetical protein